MPGGPGEALWLEPRSRSSPARAAAASSAFILAAAACNCDAMAGRPPSGAERMFGGLELCETGVGRPRGLLGLNFERSGSIPPAAIIAPRGLDMTAGEGRKREGLETAVVTAAAAAAEAAEPGFGSLKEVKTAWGEELW